LSVEIVASRTPPRLPAPEEELATVGKPDALTTTDTLSVEVVPPGPPAPPGLEAPPSLRRPEASEGSASHWLGECEPCAWFWRPGGCTNGEACLRCHLCPDGTIKAIKRAKKDLRRKGSGADDPGQPTAALDKDQLALEEPLGAEEQLAARTAAAPKEHQAAGEPEATTGTLFVEVLAPRAPPGLFLPPAPAPSSSQDLGPEAPSGLRQPEASEGSAGHWLGECEPCAWFWKPSGCSHGSACRRCHLCPDGTIGRLKKAKKSLRRGSGGADDREPGAEPSRMPQGFQPPPGLPAPRLGIPEAL
jgi:hypothetical protein